MAKKIGPLRNSGHLCSVYCPECKKVTQKISFNLLRDAGKVSVICPVCAGITWLEYNEKGKSVSVVYMDTETLSIVQAKKPKTKRSQ
jgi:hypothetical protein